MLAPHPGEILSLAASSAWAFPRITLNGRLHRSKARLGARYQIEDAGAFAVFRETDYVSPDAGQPCVLVVGFTLKLIGTNPVAHWLFQRICLLTTPFWSGLPGFRIKLWMVNPESKAYLGIYDWRGEQHAQRYVDAVVRVLGPLSRAHSVWYKLYPEQKISTYLNTRSVM